MREYLSKLFSNDPTVSLMRVMVAVVVIDALAILNYKVFLSTGLTMQDQTLIQWMLGIPFSAKMGQSFAETMLSRGGNDVPKI